MAMPTLAIDGSHEECAERSYRGYRLRATRRDWDTGLYARTRVIAWLAEAGPVLLSQSGDYTGELDALLTQMEGLVDLCIESRMVLR